MKSNEELKSKIRKVLEDKNISNANIFNKSIEELAEEVSVYHQELQYQNEELIRIREELEESKKYYLSLFDNAPIWYVVFDTDYIIIEANSLFLDFFGLSNSIKSEKLKITGIISPPSQDEFYFHLRRLNNLVLGDETEIFFIRKDNQIPVKISTNKFKKDKQVLYLSAIIDLSSEKEAKQELINSEQKFRNLFEQSNDAIYIVYNNQFDLVNRKFCELFEITENEIKSPEFNLMDLVSPKSKEYITERFSVFRKGQIQSDRYQFTGLTKSGRELTLDVSVSYITYKTGRGIQGILRDITQQRIAEERIRESEEKFRLIAENTSDGLLVIDDKLLISYASPSYLHLTGLKENEIFNKSIYEFFESIHPDDRDSIISYFDFSLPNRSESEYFRFRMKHKKGHYFWREDAASYYYNEEGEIYRIFIIARNISERIKAYEEIKKLNKAIESSPICIVITDSEGKIEYVNPEFEKTTLYSKEEVIGRNPRLLSANTKPKSFYKNLWDTITRGDIWIGEFHNQKANGELFWEYAVISPVINDYGEITNYVALKENITEKKKIMSDLIEAKDLAESSERLKTEFLAQMSHEIRTPLNVILNSVSLLKEELHNNDSEIIEFSFRSISSASQRIIRTIDLILNMTEIQTGIYKSQKIDISLKNIVESLELEYRYKAKTKNINYTVENLLLTDIINTDENALIQIVNNLVDNAIKYTKSGSVKVTFNETESDICIKVEDTGIGISEEFLPNLFSKFTQEEQGYTRSYEGNGLGLALVKRYCEIIGANITVVSKKGEGSVFTVCLPIE